MNLDINMRKSYRTISYIVYPPNYVPGDGYVDKKCLSDALKQCRKKGFGAGSEVVRLLTTRNNHGAGGYRNVIDIFIYIK